MKKKLQLSLVLAVLAGLSLFANPAAAQDRSERRENALKDYREKIEVKADDDWKKIEPLVEKVMDAQFAGFGGFGGRGGGQGGGRAGGGGGGGGGNRGAQTMPEQEALQKALEEKAPADEIKAKLAKYREARKARDAEREGKLEKAQEDLRKALTPRQEAGAVMARLLK